MKIKKSILIIGIMIMIMAFPCISNAGMTITSSSTKSEATVSAAFAYCYNLRVSTSTLGDNKLDPHLMLNSDYAAAAYLGLSTYGSGSSTNSMSGNDSGVSQPNRDWTSSIITGYESNDYRLKYIMEFSNTKYVESLPTEVGNKENIGRGICEGFFTSQSVNYNNYVTNEYPMIVRHTTYYNQHHFSWNALFRPVIWN